MTVSVKPKLGDWWNSKVRPIRIDCVIDGEVVKQYYPVSILEEEKEITSFEIEHTGKSLTINYYCYVAIIDCYYYGEYGYTAYSKGKFIIPSNNIPIYKGKGTSKLEYKAYDSDDSALQLSIKDYDSDSYLTTSDYTVDFVNCGTLTAYYNIGTEDDPEYVVGKFQKYRYKVSFNNNYRAEITYSSSEGDYRFKTEVGYPFKDAAKDTWTTFCYLINE